MACIDFGSVITSLVLTTTKTLCGLFCAPFYDEIETTVKAILDPQSLDEDSNKLRQLLHDVSAMKDSEVINKWICEAKQIILQIDQRRQQESGSSNHNDDHQSSCLLCGDACSRCNLHRNIKRMINRGEIIMRPTLERETVEHIRDVPNINDGTTAERNLKQIMDMLTDDDIWCIGVWGPGGVGKSTLAKVLNNKLKSDCPFGLVKFVKLNRNDEEGNVQEAIAKSLELNMGEKVEDQIRNTLQREKFLLILDNVWSESIRLSSIGIPEKQRGSKIVLTTRSKRVCTEMEAKEVEMGYPTEEEAWQLFTDKAGEVVNNRNIKKLARDVCNECGRLPLAIVAVGSAMKGKTSIYEWNKAVNNLRNSIPMDIDVETKVYNSLKLSYDLLDDNLKSCFLYCSLYPEGYVINIEELVRCWLAEKLIDQRLYYMAAYGEGLCSISRLIESCLLEQVTSFHVKLHDVVRNVARRIGKTTERSVVFSGCGISFSPMVKLPEEVKNSQWISFVDNKEIALPEYEKDYPSVSTLVFRWSSSVENLKVSKEFLRGFRAVKALNMVGVELIDASQLPLTELHTLILTNCSGIKELPTATNVKIIDLTNSDIEIIPRTTKEFSNLKVLDLCNTSKLRTVHADTIHSLNSLELLDMRGSYEWPVRKRSQSEQATLQDLSELKLLREVYLQLAEADGTYEDCSWMERLRSYYLAYRCPARYIKNRKIIDIEIDSTDIKIGSFVLHAQTLCLKRRRLAPTLFSNVLDGKRKIEVMDSDFDTSSTAISYPLNVEIIVIGFAVYSTTADALGTSLSKLRGLTCVENSDRIIFPAFTEPRILLPELESLCLRRCDSLIAFPCGPATIQTVAPNLRILRLKHLVRLEGLFDHKPDQHWKYLEILEVIDCPELRRLPFMPSIKEIRGSIQWWNTVEWDSDETKSFMNHRFKPLD